MHVSSILSRMKGKGQGVGPFPLFAMGLPDRHAEAAGWGIAVPKHSLNDCVSKRRP